MLRKLTFLIIAVLFHEVAFANDCRFTFKEPEPNEGDYGVHLQLQNKTNQKQYKRNTSCIQCQTCVNDEKAIAIAAALNAINKDENNVVMYNATSVGGQVCQVIVTTTANFKITRHGFLKCVKCNQKRKYVDDPTPEQVSLPRADLGLVGNGTTPDASLLVAVTLENQPSDTIAFETVTFGKSSSQLLDEIAFWFNNEGITAYTSADMVLAFDLGTYVQYGTDDTSLSDWCTAYFEVEEIPTFTEWGLIMFAVVLLGFITWVFLKRRKALAVSVVEP